MSALSRLEVIMADLVATLKRIPGIVAVVDEAPREDDALDILDPKQQRTPIIYVWEGEENPDYTFDSNGSLECELPVTVECVYPYDATRGLRNRGRHWKAQIQQALAADHGRGWDETNAVRNAFDTLERANVIGPTVQDGYGCVRLEYQIKYRRADQNPYSAWNTAA